MPRLVAVEEELRGLSGREEAVEQLTYVVVCKKVFQNRRAVESTKPERFL